MYTKKSEMMAVCLVILNKLRSASRGFLLPILKAQNPTFGNGNMVVAVKRILSIRARAMQRLVCELLIRHHVYDHVMKT